MEVTSISHTYFTEEHQLFRESLKKFLDQEVRPSIDKWEKAGEIPRSIYKRFGAMDYLGLTLPESYGGLGLNIWYQAIMEEEMNRLNSGGFAAAIGAHYMLALTHLNAEGSEYLKQKYLVPGIKGELVGCLAITEPFGGSDVKAIRTTATKEGEEFVINGSKTFITNGVLSDFLIVAARTGEEGGARGISLFVIDRETPGLQATALEKLGWHASDTGEISFDSVRIPAENLLGEENNGFFYIMQHFVSERLSMAVGGYAQAEYALELTLQYMSEREAFGKKLNKFQELRHRIAQMATEIERARQFVYSLYYRYQEGDYLVKEASMAKLLATQLADRVVSDCLQCFGGYGYMEDYPLARLFRDTRLGQIGGGTSEILKEIISRMMIEGKGYQKPG